jgi:hypothetical protein
MTTTNARTTGMPTPVLHVWYDDDSEEYWVALDPADLRLVIDAAQGPGSFEENYGGEDDDWTLLDDGTKKEIAFTDEVRARLADAAQSLETCSNWKRQETDIRDAFYDLRGYAYSRATAARAALAKGTTP